MNIKKNLGKALQKAKDLYGWDQGNLYFFKSQREVHRGMIEHYKQKIGETTNKNDYNKYLICLQDEQREFDRIDSWIQSNGPEFDTNIGYRPKERRD